MQQPKKIKNNFSTAPELSVLIHQNGLSIYTHNIDRHETARVKSSNYGNALNPHELEKELDVMLQDFDLAYSKMTAIYLHDCYAVVPHEIYNETHGADYLKFNAKLLKGDVLSADFTSHGVNVVYPAYGNIENLLMDYYGEHEHYHAATLFIENYLSSQNRGVQVYVNLLDDSFYLSVVNDGALLFHNIFPQTDHQDILYYLLYTVHTLKLDPESLNLTMIADYEISELLDKIKKYLRKVDSKQLSTAHFLQNTVCA